MTDSYLTITDRSTGEYSEKRSKFLAFAFHVETTDEVKALVQQYGKEYYDARHVCYAYMLGCRREHYRAVDNGEPSGTAGKPILGQINKLELTNVLVIVVRYFGGIKLGTSGLTNAYKLATSEALQNASIVERTIDIKIRVTFGYPQMNDVMRVIKELAPTILSQQMDVDCCFELSIRQGEAENLLSRLGKIRGVDIGDY